MSTLTVPRTQTDDGTKSGDGQSHVYCCNPNLALCGTDVSDFPEVADDTEVSCVVCADLEEVDGPCRPGCQNWSGGAEEAA